MPQEAESWTDNEVLDRWTHLSFITGPPAVQQWRANTLDNPTDHEFLNRLIEQYRNRLGDLGWFMKCLNEPMARQANKERIAPSFDLKKATDDEIKQQRLQRFDLPLKPLAILERQSINRQQWLQQSQQFEKLYASQFAKKR